MKKLKKKFFFIFLGRDLVIIYYMLDMKVGIYEVILYKLYILMKVVYLCLILCFLI